MLNIAAEHEDEERNQRRTYHRRFRFPKRVEDDDISARYRNGILEVRLPVSTGATARGKQIEVEAWAIDRPRSRFSRLCARQPGL